MSAERHVLTLPDLGLSGRPLLVSLWLVPRGGEVTEGDRLLEVLAGEVTVDLSAPASGILVEKLVRDDEPIVVGQELGVIESG